MELLPRVKQLHRDTCDPGGWVTFGSVTKERTVLPAQQQAVATSQDAPGDPASEPLPGLSLSDKRPSQHRD